jgi:L-ascorbate metabolism protein UlaG (beta-lactamase superfamily)
MYISPQFGGKPKGERLKRIESAFNYKDGKFRNLTKTVMDMNFREGIKVMGEFMKNGTRRVPGKKLPVSDYTFPVLNKKEEKAAITWFGHSAILLEIEGYRIFLDPMLGPAASPVPFLSRRFKNEIAIPIDEIPEIDAVIFSHDHYDHLDYHSIQKLKDRVGHFFVPLGIGAHLERWGVPAEKITELNWWEETKFEHFTFVCTPSRHFSGRGISDRDKTLWASWVIHGDNNNVFFSGDSGYFDGFKEIGEKYGPFDLTMLECGQYNKRWHAIHMMPEETAQANVDLKGKIMMPIHWGAFNLSLHDWDDSVIRVRKKADELGVTVATPRIGQRWQLNDTVPATPWWEIGS